LLQFRLYAELPGDWQNIDWPAVQDDLGTQAFEVVVTIEDVNGVAIEDRPQAALRRRRRPRVARSRRRSA
jgi:hypothetical protein